VPGGEGRREREYNLQKGIKQQREKGSIGNVDHGDIKIMKSRFRASACVLFARPCCPFREPMDGGGGCRPRGRERGVSLGSESFFPFFPPSPYIPVHPLAQFCSFLPAKLICALNHVLVASLRLGRRRRRREKGKRDEPAGDARTRKKSGRRLFAGRHLSHLHFALLCVRTERVCRGIFPSRH